MTDTLWGFLDEASMRRLISDHERLNGMVDGLKRQVAVMRTDVDSKPARTRPFFIAKTTSTVSAISGDTVGSGTADIYYRNQADDVLTVLPSGTGHTVYNMAAQVASGTWIGIEQDTWGDFWVTVENCP